MLKDFIEASRRAIESGAPGSRMGLGELPDLEESQRVGKEARELVPRKTLFDWQPALDRPDPVELLVSQGESRVQELLPLRYGRMSVSPFTFYRGGALIMASDLSRMPRTGFVVQACGDAHISNFGAFCGARPPAGVRHQRLRRDAARSLGVGSRALGCQRGNLRARLRAHA